MPFNLGGMLSSVGRGLGNIGGGIMGLFGGGGSNPGGGPQLANASQFVNQPNSGGGRFGQMFKNAAPIIGGLGTLFGSQMIGNPKMPKMPDSFNQFQAQANAGGPAIQQQGNQYLSTLMSGQNTAANDAATHSLDLNYQEQLRHLNGMYKSLRPGTDPTSDTTYQRDLANLNDQYARQRAQVLAQQQLGAANSGIQSGALQSQQQQAALEAQLNQIAEQWGMDYAKKAELRNVLMQLGGNMASIPMLTNMLKATR